MESARYQFSRRYLQWNSRYSRKGTLFFKQSCLNYRPKALTLRRFGVYEWKVGGIEYQEIPQIEAEIKNEEVLLFFK